MLIEKIGRVSEMWQRILFTSLSHLWDSVYFFNQQCNVALVESQNLYVYYSIVLALFRTRGYSEQSIIVIVSIFSLQVAHFGVSIWVVGVGPDPRIAPKVNLASQVAV